MYYVNNYSIWCLFLFLILLLDFYAFNIERFGKFYTEESVECLIVFLVCQTELVGSHLRSAQEPDRGEPPVSRLVHSKSEMMPALSCHKDTVKDKKCPYMI